jgi:hypothetical protein
MDDLIAERIRALDDHLRKNPTADIAIMTPGIAALGRDASDRPNGPRSRHHGDAGGRELTTFAASAAPQPRHRRRKSGSRQPRGSARVTIRTRRFLFWPNRRMT